MNIYTHTFCAACPKNQRRITYKLQLESSEMVLVEDLQAYIGSLGPRFHEDIADKLFAMFGGRQTLEAHHHGTDVKTTRP